MVRRHSRARYVEKRVSAGAACVETKVLNISVKLAALRDLSRILNEMKNLGGILGEVAIIYKVMPDGPEIDLNELKANIIKIIPEKAKLNKIEEKPIAFGLKALEVQIILNDREGGAEELEAALGQIKNVQSVETVHIGLL